MSQLSIIERTVQIMNQLPPDKAAEISDFADFIIKKYEEQLINSNIQKLAVDSKTFSFLEEEEGIYTVNDLQEKYNVKR
ncbi:MAG: hypothetical protein KGL19_12380 [Bacteroidota bacterium]|nr:hypothetical protein [Bacteroidota bacterium]